MYCGDFIVLILAKGSANPIPIFFGSSLFCFPGREKHQSNCNLLQIPCFFVSVIEGAWTERLQRHHMNFDFRRFCLTRYPVDWSEGSVGRKDWERATFTFQIKIMNKRGGTIVASVTKIYGKTRIVGQRFPNGHRFPNGSRPGDSHSWTSCRRHLIRFPVYPPNLTQ